MGGKKVKRPKKSATNDKSSQNYMDLLNKLGNFFRF